MDENNQGASAPNAASSAAIMIPKERLDQEIERRRDLERNLQFTQAQVAQMVQQQRQVHRPDRPDPELERLKQEHPAFAERYMRQQQELKQVRAGLFSSFDRQDRTDFIVEHGPEGKKRLSEVERILEVERQKGNHNANRAGIYLWMRGQERLSRDAQAESVPQNHQSTTNAPPSDPNSLGTIRAGTAGKDLSKLSFEEREKELENEQF